MVRNTSGGACHPRQLPLLFTIFHPYDWSERSEWHTGFLAPWGLVVEVYWLVCSSSFDVFPSQWSNLCIWYAFKLNKIFLMKKFILFRHFECSFYVCSLYRDCFQIWFGAIFAHPGHSLAGFHTWVECIMGWKRWEILVHFSLSLSIELISSWNLRSNQFDFLCPFAGVSPCFLHLYFVMLVHSPLLDSFSIGSWCLGKIANWISSSL